MGYVRDGVRSGAEGAAGEDQIIFNSLALFKTLRNMSFLYSWLGYVQGQHRAPKVHWRCLQFVCWHKYGLTVYTHTPARALTVHTLLNLASCSSWRVVLSWPPGADTINMYTHDRTFQTTSSLFVNWLNHRNLGFIGVATTTLVFYKTHNSRGRQ